MYELHLSIVFPFVYSSLMFTSISWLLKLFMLTIALLIELIYLIIFGFSTSEVASNEINKLKLVIQLILLYVFLVMASYLYEALLKLDYFILNEEKELNDNFQTTKKQLINQLQKFLPNRVINFYQFNKDIKAMNHYCVSSPNVAILNIFIKNELYDVSNCLNKDLEQSKYQSHIINLICQVKYKTFSFIININNFKS